MGNPSSTEHRSPKTHRNTHNGDSRSAIVVRWWCYLRKLLMAVHPHSGTALPHPAPALHTPVRLHSPPDAPPSTKWPPTSISTADGSCWNLCAIWVSATPSFPAPSVGTPLLIWLEIKKHLNGISLASPAAAAAAKIGMINVLVFVILFIVQISPKKKWRKIVQILPHV